jgi:PAS domain S-box-containing protein
MCNGCGGVHAGSSLPGRWIVPFSLGFRIYPWLETILTIRRNLAAAYGLALAMVLLALAIRWLVAEYVGPEVPFITFYPAIILAALLGGLWPGVLAAVLSTLAAWHLFMSHMGGSLGVQQIVQLLLFLFISGVNIAIAVLLDVIVDRLIIQQRNIQLLLDAAPSGFLLVDSAGTIRLANASTGGLFGYKPEELAGQPVEVLVPPGQAEAHRGLRAAYQQKPEARLLGAGRELNGRRRDGSEIPVEIGLNPVAQNGGAAVLATVVDISARKRAEASQQLLIKELEHRTRNVFTVVQALVATSARDTVTVPELVRLLNSRIHAVSQAYALVPLAGRSVSLFKVVGSQVSAHPNRIVVEGEDIQVAPSTAQHFALILHELMTNALKYGALSTPNGRVLVRGEFDLANPRLFVFSWQEIDGPPVAPPRRTGFGSVILGKMAAEFSERVVMDYAREGLLYRLEIDRPRIEAVTPVAA